MILTSLVNLYEVLAQKGKVDKPGWSKVKVSYGLEIDAEGNPVRIISLKQQKGNEEKVEPSLLSLPMSAGKTSNIAANFLCNNSAYFFGCDSRKKEKRNKNCFEASKELHKLILRDNTSEASQAIINFFDKWNVEACEEMLDKLGCTENSKKEIITKGATLMIMPFGKKPTDFPDICNAWDMHYNSGADDDNELCMVTGKHLPIARTHPSINGVYEANKPNKPNKPNMVLVSFNKPAYESFGKKQGFNAPVSEYAAFAYTTALNFLLSEKKYLFGDTTVVCWTESDNESCQDIMTSFFEEDYDELTQDKLWTSVKKLSKGESIEWKGETVNPEENFYILGLSPNASRISVRFFLHNNFGCFMRNIAMHDEEMSLVTSKYIKNTHFTIKKILKETVDLKSKKTKKNLKEPVDPKSKEKEKEKSAKSHLEKDLLYSILTGYKYPETLFYKIMHRIRVERKVKAERNVIDEKEAIRTAVIKAYLLRNYPEYKEELTMKLETDTVNHTLPYNLGRLFAILESIQNMTNPEMNTTIKDKYFTSASSTPAAVFPLLIDLSQKHMRKLKNTNPGFCVNKQKELTALFAEIQSEFPARMTMQEKGLFQIGYYHQTQANYSKNKEEK